MTVDLAGLNDNQLTAVTWPTGPLMVVAGPGSGKTRVLTYRIARLIDESPTERFPVLGITFTNKAAAEMKARIDALLRAGRDRATLTTFHAFAAEILRQHGSHIGLRPDFAILSQPADSASVLADAIKASLGTGHASAQAVEQFMPVIVRMLGECVAPDGAGAWLEGYSNQSEAEIVFREYRALSVATGQLAFDLLLALAVELLEAKPLIAEQVRRIYTNVCVDEFQDTNAAQYRFLTQLIAPAAPNLFVVADDDQLIFEWNGASAVRLQDLQKRYSMPVIQLPENFRCPPRVIELANNLIRHNPDRSSARQPLTAHKEASAAPAVIVKQFSDFDEERTWLAEELGKIPVTERPRCVILARRRKLLEDIVDALVAGGVPAYLAIRKNEFVSAPYRFIHEILRLSNARQSMEHLRRLCRAFYQLEGVRIDAQDVAARAALASEDLMRTWLAEALGRSALDPATRQMLEVGRTSLLERMEYWPFVTTARAWCDTVHMRPQAPDETAFDEYGDEVQIWDFLVKEISVHFALEELSLHQFLQELDLRAKEPPAPANAVPCLTIHGAKGTEFRRVFVAGLVEDELPGYAARKKGDYSREMQEERRSCFVAITRTEETLTLTYSGRYYGWAKQPSRFLTEMQV